MKIDIFIAGSFCFVYAKACGLLWGSLKIFYLSLIQMEEGGGFYSETF